MEQEKSGVGAVVLAIIITAVVVGGGVYFWQKTQVGQPQQETRKQEQTTTRPATLPAENKIVGTSDYEYDINTGNLKSIKDNKVIYTFSDAGKPDKFVGRPAVYIFGLDGSKLILWQTGFDNSPGSGWDYEIWLTNELEYFDLNNLSQGLKYYVVPESKKQEARKLLEQYK